MPYNNDWWDIPWFETSLEGQLSEEFVYIKALQSDDLVIHW